MRRRELLTAAAAGLVAACAPAASAPTGSVPASTDLGPLAAHPASGRWPDVVSRAPVEVREAYAYAVENYSILRYFPCYCGCGQSVGHKDNFDCYVSQPRANGWSILDTHALN